MEVIGGALAHQGGWDEALVVVVPVAILATLVAISIRRSGRPDEGTSRDGGRRGPTGAP